MHSHEGCSYKEIGKSSTMLNRSRKVSVCICDLLTYLHADLTNKECTLAEALVFAVLILETESELYHLE